MPASPGATAVTGPSPRRRRRRGPLLLLLVVALVALTAYAAWWLGMGRYTSTPGVINLSVGAAQARLAEAGLDLEVSGRQFSETVTAGSVIATDPGPGERVVEGETVRATVSKGAERFAVPPLRGTDASEVEQLLLEANLEPGTPILVWHETVPEGEVISSSPPGGTELRRGTEVVVTVSKGPEPIRIPDLAGRDAERAADRLAGLGFEVEVSERHSDTVPEGEVVRQSPERRTGKRGDTVRLVVSLGPELVEVPDLLAMSVDDATLTLEAAGFTVEVEETDLYVGLDHVVGQDPSPGEPLPRGSVVTISVV
jgi:serine/threonine-protein kinase